MEESGLKVRGVKEFKVCVNLAEKVEFVKFLNCSLNRLKSRTLFNLFL
jgi:hypothetical protein